MLYVHDVEQHLNAKTILVTICNSEKEKLYFKNEIAMIFGLQKYL
jgi:hypothetical protein